jgi:hypothetical protein
MAQPTDSSTPCVTDEQLAWFEQAQNRAVRAAVRRATRRALAAFIGIVLAGGLGSYVTTNAAFDHSRQVQLTSCQRLNVVRAQSNLDGSVIFNILSSSTQRERALSGAARDHKIRVVHKRAADQLSGQAARATVVGLTNCERAVGDPKRYRPGRATPIGDPETGAVTPEVKQILETSERVVKENKG